MSAVRDLSLRLLSFHDRSPQLVSSHQLVSSRSVQSTAGSQDDEHAVALAGGTVLLQSTASHHGCLAGLNYKPADKSND